MMQSESVTTAPFRVNFYLVIATGQIRTLWRYPDRQDDMPRIERRVHQRLGELKPLFCVRVKPKG